MSEEQLSALLAKLKSEPGLKQKLQSASNLDAAVTVAQDAGFDVSKADWLKYHDQNKPTLELSDEELEAVAGGKECAPFGSASYDSNCCTTPVC